jgi:hypothetical protein
MFRRLTFALLGALASTSLCVAQMRGGMGRPVSFSRSGGLHQGTHRYNHGSFLGSPFFYPDYDAYESSAVEGPPAQVVIVQTQPPLADSSPPKVASAPLLIEWRGDRYVRYGGAPESEHRGASQHPDYAEPKKLIAKSTASAKPKRRTESPAAEHLPAILIYGDGHREEITEYAIADGTIYVQGAFWQNGSGTKHIPLSALNRLATLHANQQRGVKFMLPSASNVVIASF